MPRPPSQKNRPVQTPDEDARRSAERTKEVDRELRSMYDDRRRDATDMRSLQQADRSFFRRGLVGLTVFFGILASLSWAGFFLFSPAGGGFKGEQVELSIDGPDRVKSGELVAYAVKYKNGEGTPLGTANMELRLPKQFKVIDKIPAPTGNTWQLGSVSQGKEGIVTITGIFIGPIDKTYDMQAILTYRPADFNSEFQKVATRGITIVDSVLELTVTAPAKVLPGDKLAITYSYKNTSQNDFSDLRFRPLYPNGFIPESSDPTGEDKGFEEWKITTLSAGADGKVVITGSFASEAEGVKDAKGQMGFVDDAGEFQLQKEATSSMDVLKGDLVTTLILNGKTSDQPVRFGDKLRYTVSYKNTGTATLENIELTLGLEGMPTDSALIWSELKDKAQGVRTGNTIVWTKKQVPSLGRIDAGDEGAIDVEIPFVSAPMTGAEKVDQGVSASVTAKIGSIDGAKTDRTAKSSPILVKAISDTTFGAEARYFDNDDIPVGTGPLPPKVGESTTYRISWTITNSLHDLSNLKLSAALPPNVVWTGKSTVDAGDLRFDAATGKMLWTLNWMPTNVTKLNIGFDVGIIPDESQKGKIPTLVDGTIFEATDKSNGFSFLLSASPLTTALESDPSATGKGRVQ